MMLNLVGVAIPLRDPQIYLEPRNLYTGDTNTVLTAEEFWRQEKPLANEPARDYAPRLCKLVGEGTAFLYQQHNPNMSKRNWRVPVYENFLLWGSRHALFLWRWARGTASWSDRAFINRYVYSDHHRAIERGVGLCGQQTAILMRLLKERGVKARYVSFPRHAVVEAEVDPGVWWVLDPSGKVWLPYDVATLQKNPGLVRPVCQAQGIHRDTVELLEASFSEPSSPSTIRDSVKDAHGAVHYYFEFASYYLIWIIPAVMITAGIVSLRRGSVREGNRRAESGCGCVLTAHLPELAPGMAPQQQAPPGLGCAHLPQNPAPRALSQDTGS